MIMRGVFWNSSHWPRISPIFRDLSGPSSPLTAVAPSAMMTFGFIISI